MSLIPQFEGGMDTKSLMDNAGTGGLPLIPEGNYQMTFISHQVKPTRNGENGLVLRAVVIQGQYVNTEFDVWFMIFSDDFGKKKGGYDNLAFAANACGMANIPGDAQQMMNKKFTVDVRTQAGSDYQDKRTGDTVKGKDSSSISIRTAKAITASSGGVFGR